MSFQLADADVVPGSAAGPAKNFPAEPVALRPLATQTKGDLMVSTLTELGRLAAHRPATGAPVEDVAAWYGQKSRLHMRLAAEAVGEDETAHELEHAVIALRHADRLRATASIDTAVLAPVEGVAA